MRVRGFPKVLFISFLTPGVWVPRTSSQTHHTFSSQEVRDHSLVQVVHQAARALVIAATIDKELPPGIFIDERADLGAEQGPVIEQRIGIRTLLAGFISFCFWFGCVYFYFIFWFWDFCFVLRRVSLCGSDWHQTGVLSALAFWMLGLQVCTTRPSSELIFLKTFFIYTYLFWCRHLWKSEDIFWEFFFFSGVCPGD